MASVATPNWSGTHQACPKKPPVSYSSTPAWTWIWSQSASPIPPAANSARILPGVNMGTQRKLSRVHGRAALVVLVAFLAAAVPAQAAKPLRVKGGQLVDERG